MTFLRRLLIDTSAVRLYPHYRRFWIAQVLSQIGNQVTVVAVMTQIWTLTHSTLDVGLIGAAVIGPLLTLGLVGGAIADAMNRKLLIQLVQTGMLATSAALAVLSTLVSHPPLWSLYSLVAIGAAFGAIEGPARSAMGPMLVDEEHIRSFVTMREVATQSGRVFGPLIGGLLIATTNVATAYATDAFSFLVAILLISGLPNLIPTLRRKFEFSSITESLSFVRKRPVLASTFIADLIAMIFGMPRAVFPAIAATTFGIGDERIGIYVGMMMAAIAAGALLGLTLSGATSRIKREGLAVLVSVAIWGAAIACFAIVHVFALALLLLAIAGAADMVSAIFRQTILLEIVPDEMRGRLGAVHIMVVTGGPPLGDIESGVAADLLGVETSVIAGGLACVAGISLLALAVPRFARWTAADAKSESVTS